MSAAKFADVAVRLPNEIVESVKAIAEAHGRTRDQEIALILESFIDPDAPPPTGPATFPVTAREGVAELAYCTGDVDAPDNMRDFMRMANGVAMMVAVAFRQSEESFPNAVIADALSGCAALMNIAVGIHDLHVEREGS